MKRVADCMTTDVKITSPDQSLRDVAREMARCDAGSMPVGENDRLVGMITDRDIAIRGVGCGLGPDAKVRQVMTNEVRYCFDDDDVDEVLETMSSQQIRRMPVLNREKRLVGIVSLGDLARGHEARQAGEALSGIARPSDQHSQTTH